ncbi:isopenicillin N synthase family dioxygenase [Pontivivens ytuae]|uniref:2-oxoglutarate-dependent ethylene/succinate-forming enzyme n=1 Tax=Pontivivens ytuae TaxID=2789856 RepID=A0A7S9QE30_9RHOB|nr:isopenicillin N synthase family oxygenase [Pontivivens ytuae]QPH55908.1 isopenicillin N synthase family oxygenase [Pontivivens ytuae]
MIPRLDIRQQGFAQALGEAARGPGFFLLDGHGLDPAPVFAAAEAFFAQPQEAKDAVSIRHSAHNRGYVTLGEERLDDTTGAPDQKEAFNVGLDLAPDDPRVVSCEPFRGTNLWPDLPGFRTATLGWYNSAWALGVDLMRAVAVDLGLEAERFSPDFDAPLATLRLLRYPAEDGAGGIGAGAHTDYGALTLLMTDGTAGLQVKPRDGDWIDVPPAEGAFVVNIGDCLMRWTNGIYASTPHRVLPPPRERYSVAFFLDPNPDAMIAALPGTGAPQWPPVSGADYLRSRLEATYG